MLLKNRIKALPVCAVLTTSVWGRSRTLTPLMVRMMSPTSRPDDSAGVLGSMADTTTGREPWIRNPNSPRTRSTRTDLLHSEKQRFCVKSIRILVTRPYILTKSPFQYPAVHDCARLSVHHPVSDGLVLFSKLSLALSRLQRIRTLHYSCSRWLIWLKSLS